MSTFNFKLTIFGCSERIRSYPFKDDFKLKLKIPFWIFRQWGAGVWKKWIKDCVQIVADLPLGSPGQNQQAQKQMGVDAVKILAFSSQSVVISKDGYEKCLSIYYANWTA